MTWKKDPEPDDPNLLVGVHAPGGPEAVREMAVTFADEFARMGYNEESLMRLFQNPFYVGPYGVYRKLGESAIRDIIQARVGIWGKVKNTVRDRDPASIGGTLPSCPVAAGRMRPTEDPDPREG